jgi:AbrB family looped-hinge helix DNA binding protein
MAVVKAKAQPRIRRRGVTRISTKNQVTLPVEALRKAGLRAGEELRVEADGSGRIVLIREDDPITRYAGIFHYPKGYLKKLRSEWRY